MTEKEAAHQQAKQRDARELFDRGDRYRAVIIEENVDPDGTGLSKIQGVKTFVRPINSDEPLPLGSTVEVKIIDVGKNHTEALGLKTVDEVN